MRRRIKRDPGERKHRRTSGHPDSVRMMAEANFDAVPPLSEVLSDAPSEDDYHVSSPAALVKVDEGMVQ